ncbi:MAG: hypothetical protein ISN28_08240 [Ectothiorhodospiraceae bacterium AqS1]|nr:hypothetical protein [Ectothiorhodospiraceae bacterium AqS1]
MTIPFLPSTPAIDHLSANCAAERGTRFEALQPFRQGVKEHFSNPWDLPMRHNNESQYISHDFQDEIRTRFIGWKSTHRHPSFAQVRQRLCQAIHPHPQENLLWLTTYSCIEDLQRAVQRFKDEYNEQWLVKGHGHHPPSPFIRDKMDEIPVAA